LYNEEGHDLNSPQNIIRVIISRRMEWPGMWNVWGRGVLRTGLLVGWSEGKRLLASPWLGCQDNIKKDVKCLGWKGVD
jgi:hypothetical protein